MKNLVTLAALAAVCVGSVSPALALSNRQNEMATDFAVNNMTWVLYHEVGHLFVDQFQLPVLGAREEDAADALATLMLLGQETEQAATTLQDAVDGWMMSDAWYNQGTYDKYDFYDPHAIDIVRGYAIACLMVGADYSAYRPLASAIGMEGDRVSTCAYDYELARRSWAETLEPHRSGAKRTNAEIEIVYDKPAQGLEQFARMIQSEGLLEEIARTVADNYSLQRSVTFRATSCGVENAFYDGGANEIQLCYEYVKLYYNMKVEELHRTGEGQNDDSGDTGTDKNGDVVGTPTETKGKDKN